MANRRGTGDRQKVRSRWLGIEPLEGRLPPAGGVTADLASEPMVWQGHEVEVQRGGRQ
jgi:hypothetical protein